jgi:two-component sensor histidine kinase
VERIDKITRDILTLERIEGMAKGVLTEVVDMTELVTTAFDDCEASAAEKTLDYQLDLESKALRVLGDTVFLRESVHNLLSNAIKYTPSGGIIILSASDIMQEGAAYLRIEVSDSGYGVPEEIRKDIFTEYTHGNSKAFSYSNPTGIGLAYCKLAVEANGGEIGILSTDGGGTTIWFTLLKGDQSVLFSPDNVMKNGPHQEPSLLDEDISLAGALVTRLKAVGIFEISIILKILNNDIFEFNDRLRTWRDEMKRSVYTGNNTRYNSLLSLFEAGKTNH